MRTAFALLATLLAISFVAKVSSKEINGGRALLTESTGDVGNANGVPTVTTTPNGKNEPPGHNGRKLLEGFLRALLTPPGLTTTTTQTNGGGNTPNGNANGVPTTSVTTNNAGKEPPGQNGGGRKLLEGSSIGRALLKITQTNGGGKTPNGNANGVPYTNPAGNQPGGFNKP
ncbi:hypothetical protein N2152v2_007235 [Parachlorella kessleri]